MTLNCDRRLLASRDCRSPRGGGAGGAARARSARLLRAPARRRGALRRRGPVSALDIAGGLDGRLTCVDAASVYANLETFEQLGLVTHVHVGHGPGLYALADRVARHYVCCEHCGALRALPATVLAGVRAAIREATGYQARFTHFPIMGLCPGCQAESSPHA